MLSTENNLGGLAAPTEVRHDSRTHTQQAAAPVPRHHAPPLALYLLSPSLPPSLPAPPADRSQVAEMRLSEVTPDASAADQSRVDLVVANVTAYFPKKISRNQCGGRVRRVGCVPRAIGY